MGAEGAPVHSTLLDIAQRHFASYFLDNFPGKKKKKKPENTNRKLVETLQKMAPNDLAVKIEKT